MKEHRRRDKAFTHRRCSRGQWYLSWTPNEPRRPAPTRCLPSLPPTSMADATKSVRMHVCRFSGHESFSGSSPLRVHELDSQVSCA
eukprot:scaffold1661_cov251-Pinguiococcus_pyrenoidosus.AAC.40